METRRHYADGARFLGFRDVSSPVPRQGHGLETRTGGARSVVGSSYPEDSQRRPFHPQLGISLALSGSLLNIVDTRRRHTPRGLRISRWPALSPSCASAAFRRRLRALVQCGPSRAVWPSRNDTGAPVYLTDDFVPWKGDLWTPDLPAARRGQTYSGELAAYRLMNDGRPRRPPQ